MCYSLSPLTTVCPHVNVQQMRDLHVGKLRLLIVPKVDGLRRIKSPLSTQVYYPPHVTFEWRSNFLPK